MKKVDMRFNNESLKNLIGHNFNKYRCDKFEFTNSVTQIVGLYIGDEIYRLTNIQESVDYFGNTDDYAVFKMSSAIDEDIRSAFVDTEQIDNPINQEIKSIILINERQRIYKENICTYDVYLTRAIIFRFSENEICFQKDFTPFSEEIFIMKGYNLADSLMENTDFLEEWDDDLTPKCETEIVEIN